MRPANCVQSWGRKNKGKTGKWWVISRDWGKKKYKNAPGDRKSKRKGSFGRIKKALRERAKGGSGLGGRLGGEGDQGGNLPRQTKTCLLEKATGNSSTLGR